MGIESGKLASERRSDHSVPPPSTLSDALARIAELETENAELAEANAEMSFLVAASTLLGSTLDEPDILQAALDCVVSAIEDRVAGCFIVLRDGDMLACAANQRISAFEAEQFIAQHSAVLGRCLRALTVHIEPNGVILVPLCAGRRDPVLGVLVVAGSDRPRSTSAVRRLNQLGELTGKSLANARLFAQSIVAGVTDELTGVFNRRYLDRRLAEELKRARRLGEPLALVLLDLDFFKAVNDAHGHQEGDRMLCAVARTIVASVRDIDLVTRWGGEEFAIVFPGATAGQAVVVAERIRSAIEDQVVVAATGAKLRITVSCGVAWVAPHIHTPAQCIAAADRCLLEAKRLGRNRTIAMKAV
jgi:diguanylate cyclase (GGDEF)-like protein